ncbi:hypothetical protein Tco_0122178 [Tanacetum coccineum]
MLARSDGGLILYQAYDNLYAMTGRKAHLLEDKQIPSVGVFDKGNASVRIKRLLDDLEVIAVKLVLLVQKLLLLVLKVNVAGLQVTTAERLQLLKG